MGNVLDAIVRNEMIGSRENLGPTVYETISVDGSSVEVDASGVENGYSVLIEYDNGIGSIDITFSLEGSVDGNSWGQVPDTAQQITDTDGSITWDVISSNINFVRIAYAVTSGTLDCFAVFSGKRRH